ncbi:unnamed protein product [Peniophora sp. CBMAI 1063]|nr:unnamed protein product [Peniophora sp. CBMAI 1063]
MSSDEEDQYGAGPSAPKRRRRVNACDMCRKRKIRCDGKQGRQGKCTNCSDHNWDCTFIRTPTKKYAPGYVEALELKVKKLQSLISRMLPGQDFSHEVGFELTPENWMFPGVCGAPEPEYPSAFVAGPISPAGLTPDAATPNTLSVMAPDNLSPTTPMPDDQHSSDDDRRDLTVKLQSLRTAAQWVSRSYDISSYLGKSSPTGLVKTAFEMRKEVAPDATAGTILRSKVWKRPAWLEDFRTEAAKPLIFPEQDLMDDLVRLYFQNLNILMPVLHRPTFEDDLRSSLHLRDRAFGSIVLIVCALGSRFSHDKRVLLPSDQTWLSAGWKWFSQTKVCDDATVVAPNSHLHLLQATCLATLYASGISQTHAWMYTGAGIRLILDIGAHKRRAYGPKPTLEDELYKRAFWTLLYLDRTMSSAMGRPCGLQEEDFDLEMPLCCDDEYLLHEDPEQVGKQPDDKPSLLSYFVWTLKLTQIQGLALRTLYASTKAKAHYNFRGEEWLTRTVAHFDSLLNNWIDSVPAHLRWDPSMVDDTFFFQSAQLYMQYHTTQIMVHRPFISVPPQTTIPFPSLAICTNAARSMTRMTEALHKRNSDQVGVLTWISGNAGIVILVGLGLARLGRFRLDRKQAMQDIELLISIMRDREDRWRWAGRQADVLESLKILGEAPDSIQFQEPQRKRIHGAEAPIAEARETSASSQPTAGPSGPAAPNDFQPAMDWEAPSVFDHSTAGPDIGTLGDHQSDQSTGAVFGNVDFGALFGLGEGAPEGAQTWSPSSFEATFDPSSTGVLSGGMGFGTETWAGMSFDFGMEDWQWTAPPQQNAGKQGSGGHSVEHHR